MTFGAGWFFVVRDCPGIMGCSATSLASTHSILVAPPSPQILTTKNISWIVKWKLHPVEIYLGFPCGSDGKESACSAGDLSLIHGSGRCPEEANGYPLQYSCLENSMDRGTWRAIVHGVAKSWTWLSDQHTHIHKLMRKFIIKLIFYEIFQITSFHIFILICIQIG